MVMADAENIRNLIVGLLVLTLLVSVYTTIVALKAYADVRGDVSQPVHVDLSGVDISKSSSTATSLVLVFPELKFAKEERDVVDAIIPTGRPGYADRIPVSYDDPVGSLNYLYKLYPEIREEVRKDTELWNRYLNLATRPVGISCEFCCGVGPVGITAEGELRCGCKHNPALHALTLALLKYTDMSDAEVVREVMRWKALFFPRPMTSLALQVAGKELSEVQALPGMVGGC